MKVFVDRYCVLDREMLENEFEVLWGSEDEDPQLHQQAEFWIFFSTYRYPVSMSKTIMIQNEPPLADHRIWLYSIADEFHSWYCFNPVGDQFPVTRNPLRFPYYPRMDHAVVREDLTIGERGVYYAGSRHGFENAPDAGGSINLYPVRSAVAQWFLENHNPSYIYGSGWPKDTKSTTPQDSEFARKDWRVRKWDEIAEHDVDFVFCMENSMYPGYISEKLHDGFLTDRVAMYLGSPSVAEIVPEDCYIELSEYFDRLTKQVDAAGILKRITEMSQTEYEQIIGHAREVRKDSSDENYREERKHLTAHVIERVKNG